MAQLAVSESEHTQVREGAEGGIQAAAVEAVGLAEVKPRSFLTSDTIIETLIPRFATGILLA